MNLQNKVVIITGSSSGIGAATAELFAGHGAKIALNYAHNQSGGEEILAKLQKISPAQEHILIQADLATEAGVDKLFRETLAKFGRVDILINNGGIPTDKVPFMDASLADMEEMIHADLLSVLMCSQRAAKIMAGNGGGKILNTASIRGWQFGGRAAVYAACKAGVINFTATFAKMVAADNILVNAVAPGFTKTRNYNKLPPEMVEGFIEATALKRFVAAEEIADAFLFLAKNDAITGQTIYVEAGYMLNKV